MFTRVSFARAFFPGVFPSRVWVGAFPACLFPVLSFRAFLSFPRISFPPFIFLRLVFFLKLLTIVNIKRKKHSWIMSRASSTKKRETTTKNKLKCFYLVGKLVETSKQILPPPPLPPFFPPTTSTSGGLPYIKEGWDALVSLNQVNQTFHRLGCSPQNECLQPFTICLGWSYCVGGLEQSDITIGIL